ncbi:hypothetical protein [Paenibacillus periandrae]|uniref:hypothetical protein n=1 Tax=Paenibacillus periandrae TaxID=1761741 RepID=UPI001F08E90E|nr:hypothetical protein [Paenibacillus periandrae]
MSDLNRDELMQVFKKVKISVRQKAKEAGAPLFYVQDGHYIREEPNGEKIVLDKGERKIDPYYKK